MSLRNKSIEELLDLEEEYRLAVELERDGAVSRLITVYEALYKKISIDENSEYSYSLESIKKRLIHYLVKHGTYLKTIYQKDDMAAEHCLKKAIQYERHLPIAHYRLGFLYYKKKSYLLALIHFKNAIQLQKKEESSPEYRMNDQQLYNTHLFLANCGLFIARGAQEDLEKLDLKVSVSNIPQYKMSPFFQVINENDQYLDNHAYQMVSEAGSHFCSKEECEEQLDIGSMIIVDLSGRQDLLVFNGRQKRLSKNQSELLRFFLVHSNEEHPATIKDVFDLFSPVDEYAEIPRNTFTQNVRRLVEKLVQVGIEETIIENKAGFGVTAYYYNHKLPYLIMHRSDETFILTK